MNRNKTIAIVAVLAAVLVASAFTVVQFLPDAYTVQAQKIFNDALTKIEQIRNVTMPDGINLHVITKQQAKDWWGTPSGTTDLTNINRTETIYKSLFLMPQTDSLYQATGEWTANWAAATASDKEHGIYDIYVIRENFNPFDEEAENTFIHELTHVWQPLLTTPTTFDEDKAHTSLTEGDASFMGDYYINMTINAQASTSIPAFLLSTPWLDNVYPMANTLWMLNYFPYDQGEIFVSALYEQDGFATINQAYQQGYTPSTTAQIIHPELYFANQTAQPINAPNLTDNSWTLVQTDRGQDHNTYGELFIKTMLINWLNESEVQQAAAGWRGDNFTYYENGTDFLFTWNIGWSTSEDANEFATAFQDMVTAAGATYTDGLWFANDRYLSLTLNAEENSTLIVSSPTQNLPL